MLTDPPQCLTLSPVIALQTELANDDNKKWLADALYHLRAPPTGSVDGDIRKLSTLVQGCVAVRSLRSTTTPLTSLLQLG